MRGPNGTTSIRGPVRRWNSFHGGGVVNFVDNLTQKNIQEPVRAVPKAVQALRSESVDRGHRIQPPPPPAFPRRRFSVW